MPFVHVRTAGKLAKEQREKIVARITDVIVEEAKKPREYVWVVIEEVPTDHFAVGGEMLG